MLAVFHALCKSALLAIVSDQSEQVWIWEYETEDGCHDLYMDVKKGVRFRVAEEIFFDVSPLAQEANEAAEKENKNES